MAAPGCGDPQRLGAIDGANQVLQLLCEGVNALDLNRRIGTVALDRETIRIRIEDQHAVGAGDLDLAFFDTPRPVAGVDNRSVQPIAQLDKRHVGIVC